MERQRLQTPMKRSMLYMPESLQTLHINAKQSSSSKLIKVVRISESSNSNLAADADVE